MAVTNTTSTGAKAYSSAYEEDRRNNYINYNDKKFQQVESDKQQALTDLEQTYGGMISESDKFYQAQIDASKQWADTQTQLQQEQTDFAIEQIQQQKDQAYKDYTKEQSGAYVDWQKQSNGYGTQAEQMASAGLTGTGFSESSQVSMYNTYQNRVSSARESYNQIVMNYNNQITQARLQNNSVLAEIAYETQKQQLELALEGFQYKNNLILEQANKKVELDNIYHQRWLDVLNQLNTDRAFREEVRQFEQNYALSQKQLNEQIRQFNQEYQLKKAEYEEGIRQFNEEIARLKKKDEQEYQLEIQNLELKKKQLQQEQAQFEAEQALKKQQLEEEKRQFNEQMAWQKKKASGSGGSSSSKRTSSDRPVYTIDPGVLDEPSPEIAPATLKSIAQLGYTPHDPEFLQAIANGEIIATKDANGDTVYKRKPSSSGTKGPNKNLTK